MDLKALIDFVLHIDKYLLIIINQIGSWTYVILFLIVFVETGLVIMPFLPGDSLLFAAGALAAASNDLNIIILYIAFLVAAVVGDTVNYWIGHKIGEKAFTRDYKFIKKDHLLKAKAFYQKYGGRAIILSRFVPIVRTFAPFVAGIGVMHYRTFLIYNFVGAFAWVTLFLFAGFLFGNIPIIKNNFEIVIPAVILLSVIPIIVEYAKSKLKKES